MEHTAAAVVERMCEVQPSGPFAIVGYSFGGNLAVEVARQLISRGQLVELVIIIDAYAPDLLRSSQLKRLAKLLQFLADHPPRESYAYVLILIQRRLRRLFPKVPAADPAPPLPQSELERQLAEVSERCTRAYDRHRPKAFSGRIVLIAAADRDNDLKLADPSGTRGWNSICKGGIEIIRVACHHSDFFKKPYVDYLARRIDHLLSAIDKTS
jgi:acetoacetyl-CoA synthetase